MEPMDLCTMCSQIYLTPKDSGRNILLLLLAFFSDFDHSSFSVYGKVTQILTRIGSLFTAVDW